MVGILEKLGLKKKPNATVAGARDSLRGFAKGLPAGNAVAPGLLKTTERLGENLSALRGKGEQTLYQMKCAEMAGIAERMEAGGTGGGGFAMDLAQLELLSAETGAVRSGKKADAAVATAARDRFAKAFAQRFAAGGDLRQGNDMGADMAAYLRTLAADESRDGEMQAALRALDLLKAKRPPEPDPNAPPVLNPPPPPPVDPAVTAAAAASKALAAANQADGKAMGASTAPREAQRTPNDVLVHLMSAVTAAQAKTPSAELKAVADDGRKLFMTHTLDVRSVDALIDRAKAALGKAGAPAAICDTLKGQLPAGDAGIAVTQQQENLYGRVFDTKLVSALVADPPDTFKAAMGSAGAELNKALPDNDLAENAAMTLAKKTVAGDLRSWTGAVPGLQPIAAAKTGKEALAALRTFLKTPPTTGPEIVAFPFVMAKLSLAMRNCGVDAPWLEEANKNYGDVIMKQAVRDTAAAEGPVSEGAGITLLHQPAAETGTGLNPSVRPGTVNRFGERRKLKDGEGLEDLVRTEATVVAHEQSLPFASGVSGTTNILLHLLKHQKAKGATVDAKDFLMGSMMFLVYDGGHSIHEVMWTANQLDAKLGLGLGIGDPSKPNEFVSDYDGIGAKLGGDSKTAFGTAMDDAWTGTQDYLQANSYFAQIGADEEDEEESEAALSN